MKSTRITDDVLSLICDLEFIIGTRCQNNNVKDHNRPYRQPIHYSHLCGGSFLMVEVDGEPLEKMQSKMLVGDSYSKINSLQYEFGATTFNVGESIIDVLRHIEERYNISFAQLEKCRKCRLDVD